MPDLIPFATRQLGNDTVPTVNARDLHDFLTPKTRFDTWIMRRIQQYGFQEGRDFTTLKIEHGTTSTQREYHLTLGMAKELSMVERTKKGKEARQYFLACEAQLKTHQAGPAVINPEHQLMIDMIVRIDQNEQRAIRAEATATRAESKADMMLDSQQFLTVAEYVYINQLQHQLPTSAYKACSDHLRLYCLDRNIPTRRIPVGDKRWDTEYGYHVSVWAEVFPGWLLRRNGQSTLPDVYTEDWNPRDA